MTVSGADASPHFAGYPRSRSPCLRRPVRRTRVRRPLLRLLRISLPAPPLSVREALAQEAEGDRPVNHFSIHPEDAHGDLSRCGGCPLGAQHAGLPKPPYRSLLAKDPGLCLRCGHGGARLVGGRACISCYNRGQEYLRGSNGKGTAPVFALRVAPLSLAY